MTFLETFDISKEYLIAHAGGSIEDTIYTNSYEAIINSINKGYKYIEIDFRILNLYFMILLKKN